MPYCYSQLISAQLENKAADYAAGTRGRIWWNTVNLKVMSDDGTNVRALLRNDQACVFGNNGTANSNIRLNRAAASVLQLVLGGDTTAEGSLSTSLAQLSSRVENYTTAALPTFGNAGRLLFDTTTTGLKIDNGAAIKEIVTADLSQTLTNKTYDTASNTFKATGAAANSVPVADGSGNVAWTVTAGSLEAPNFFFNGSLVTSVAGSAMTIALKDNAGSDPSAGSPVKIAFRNATAATGNFVVRSVTGALSVTITSGATLGHYDAVDQYIYVFALDNAGTVELAVIGSRFDIDPMSIQSTTALSSGADDWNTLYSTTSRSNKAVSLIARIKSNQTTAGTYASNATEISLYPGYMWPTTSSKVKSASFTVSGWGTITNDSIIYQRNGDTMICRGKWTNGTVAAATGYIQLPSGLTIDSSSTKIYQSANGVKVGTIGRLGNGVTYTWTALFYESGTSDKVFFSLGGSADDVYQKTNVSSHFGTGEGTHFEFEVPIAQWRSY